jgi:hypothetical protein
MNVFLPTIRAFALASALPVLASASAGSQDTGASGSSNAPLVLAVVGAAGEAEFGGEFVRWAGLDTNAPGADLDRLQRALQDAPKDGAAELWLVLLGHGTFDGREARFNLRGPDLTTTNLAGWLKPFTRPLAVLDTSSASAPFLARLSRTNRVIVTATRSGSEQNFARLGGQLAAAIADAGADLDKDGQTSLLEAYLAASRGVGEFYASEGRLATEHPLLDDNGDGFGTPADWFRGVRAVKRAKENAALDGFRAHQFHLVRSEAEQRLPADARAKRDGLELAINRLRDAKPTLDAAEYDRRLEALLIELARLYESAAGGK